MNEQRIDAYFDLIKQLLNCPNGEELQILDAKRELVDSELLRCMAIMAEQQEADGNHNAADFLRSLRNQLLEVRGISETPTLTNPSYQDYVEFFKEVLQAIADSKGDPQVIYPLLQANLDKLDDNVADILIWTSDEFLKADPETAEYISLLIGQFCELISDFPLGNKTNNIEIAIAGYKVVLKVFTREMNLEVWAEINNNLGCAYFERIRGDKAENLEMAIASHQRALQVYTHEAFSADWAMTQNNLGNAYSERIRGDEAENLEMAIAAYQHALQVYTSEAFPADWAMTQNNLGNAYSQRIRGDKAENLEMAIAAFQRALSVYTPEAFPVEWANIQNNCGNAYLDRIQGDKAENLEIAIAAFQGALSVYTAEANSIYWANTHNNLGNAYLDRIQGDRAENLEIAIAIFQRALSVYTQEAFPTNWAMTQNNLGTAYLDRIRGDKAENLEIAIAIFQQVLSVITKEANPIDWSMIQNNLGRAYNDRIQEDKAENLEMAHLEEILKQLPDNCQQLILVPHRLLHLLPLHALPLPNQADKCLLDKFPQGVRYSPSCQLLQLTQNWERSNFSDFFGIQNPTQDLTYASLQVEVIRQQFDSTEVLVETAATKTALMDDESYYQKWLGSAHCVHFACHGDFNENSPLESCLKLANKEPLTLGEIFGLNIDRCRLVALSACETGLTDSKSLSDEYISLPSGFLFAGTPSVINSLWKVDELATAFLTIKFYENLKKYPQREAGEVAIALNQAQMWLRDLTSEDFEKCLDQFAPQIQNILASLSDEFEREIAEISLQNARDRQPRPFASPFYWSGFIATGR
ncbi:CHAT domain-containing protein [Coleofasciculus sp. E1-EBD-02]|uniref:CHAT domain-containing protein n=1 Tax=Coleofasciculus sp. E1-EBD-02 TaxID=3068481 RepID=UPI0033038FA9